MYPTQSMNFLANCLEKAKNLFASSKDPPTTIPQVTRCYIDMNTPEGWLVLELRRTDQTNSANLPLETHISDHSVDEPDSYELRSLGQIDSANLSPETHISDHSVDESDCHELFVPCGSGAIKFLASPQYVDQIFSGDPPKPDFVDPSQTQNSAYRDECTMKLACNGELVKHDVQLQWIQRDSRSGDSEPGSPVLPVEDSGVTQYLIFKGFHDGQLKIDLRFRHSGRNGETGAHYGADLSTPNGTQSSFPVLKLPRKDDVIKLVVTPDSVRKLLNGDLSMVQRVSLTERDILTRCEQCTVNMSYTGVSISCDVLIQWREYNRSMVDLESQQEKFCWWDFVVFGIRDALEQPTISALALTLVGGWIFMRPRTGMATVYFCLGLWIFTIFSLLLIILFFVFWKDRATPALYLLILIPTGIMAVCFILKCILISCKRISTMRCCILEFVSITAFLVLFMIWIWLFEFSPEEQNVVLSP